MSTKLWQRVFSVLVLAGMLVTFVRPGSALANPRIDPLANPTGKLAAAAGAVEVVYPLKADVSPALRDITPKTSTAGAVRVIPSFSLPKAETSTPDHITVAPDKPYAPNMPNPLVNFEGVHNIYGYQPPDTQGDVGPNHYVQWVNVSFAIWNKAGILLYGPADGNTLWSGFGGACENTNHGDPITLYDPLADRWFMSQFSVDGPYIQCIAVSVTPDPTGSWYRYAYIVSTTKMNDYPKFGVWPDAYYMTVNQFTGGVSWGGAGVAAFERQQMLLGNPAARMVYIDLYAGNPNYGNILPADLDGPPNGLQPPANAPGLYVEWDDSTWLPDPSDMLRVWEFHVDWTTPANSTFGANANYDPNYMIPTANVDPDMCGGSRDCIPQPGTSQHLDAIADRLMYRLQYRNFGGYQTLVTNHTVDINNTDHAGVHWFELRDTGSGWGMYQQGVWGSDADHRWMASAALDHSGNLAVGYSVSSSTTYPSARYAGRLAGDPVGTLAQGEAILAAGTGSQTSFSNRWGDYSMMGVDPTDDCTFWYTQQYYQTNSYDWRTRVGSFKFPSCSIGSTGTLNGTVTNANNSSPIPGAQVTATSSPTQTFGTTTGEAGTYAMIIPNGIYTVTASAFSFVPSTLTSVTVLSGMVTTRNFALTPAVSSLVSGGVTDANTGWPLYASVTVEGIPLAPVWTDPETGSYSITLPNGNYTFDVEAFYPGYVPETAAVNVAGPTTQDFALDMNVGTCNAPGYELSVSSLYNQDFESWPPSGWTVDNNVAGGLGWDLDSNYGDTNYTGGAGHAADVNSDANYGVPYDTELRSPAFDLSAIGVASLNYRLNYQNISTDALDVDISTNGGSTWTNLRHFTTDQGSLYATPGVLDSIDLSGYGSATNAILRWRYYTPDTSPWDWYAQVDEVRLVELDCSPQDGGLVVGNVYDANTTLPLVGADVVSDKGTSSTTIPTPADLNLDDGFYFMFATTGTHEITATLGVYQPNVATVPVPHYGAIRQDFDLTAGMLSYLPDSFDVTLQMSYTATQQLTLTNAGGVAVSFELKELDKGVVPLGPFEQPTNGVVKPFRQYFKTALDIKVPRPLPEAAPLAAGDVITSFVPTSNSSSPWGIAFDGSYSTVWVGEGWGRNQIFEYGPNGTSTDRSYPFTWGPSYGPADAAYNQNTGMLWSLDVVDNCIHEIDPDYGVTGNTVCPSFPTSQRGLAYDPSTDTWYTGGWNDAMIYHFDSAGVTLASYNTGLPISGLAYNPDTQHLFVMVNASPTNPVYVLDAANNFVILGQFTIAGFTAYGGAGMEFDCNGNLWAVDQASNMVYQFESGETTKMCSADVPWLSESPITGTMPSASNQIVDISFDAGVPEITQPGIYHAQLKIVHDTPYVVANLPVTLTVLAPPSMGKLNGTVTSLGYCDLDPAPIEGATIVIKGSSGTITLTTDTSGTYQRWLNVSDGPFIVSVTAPNHTFDMVSGVVIVSLETTTVGFDLRLLEPCVTSAPPSIEVTLVNGYSTTLPLTLDNGGAVGTDFKLAEKVGGFTPPIIPSSDGMFARGNDAPSSGHAPITGKGAPAVTVELPSGNISYAVEAANSYFTAFDLDVPEVLPNISSFSSADFSGAGTYYNDSVYVIDVINNLYQLDPETGAVLNTMTVTAPPGGETYAGLAVDPTSGDVFAASTSCDTSSLLSIDLDTGIATLIGTLTNAGCAIDLAIDGSGQAYTYDIINDMFLSVNLATGAGTVIGSIGFDANFGQGMAWDPLSDQIYLAAFNGSAFQAELRVVDTSTGNTALIGVLGATTPGGTTQLPFLAIPVSTGFVDKVPWLSEAPITGTLNADGSQTLQVTLDAGVPEVVYYGTYTATLSINTDDPVHPKLSIPVTMIVVAPTYGVSMTPDHNALLGAPGETVTYTLHIVNTGNLPNTYTLGYSGNLWNVQMPVTVVTLDPGESTDVVVLVTIPDDATLGNSDDVDISITGAGGANAWASLTTTVLLYNTYLPLIFGTP
jgi:hypothetical protein